MSSSAYTMRSPGTGAGSAVGGVGGAGRVTSSQAPPTTRSERARTTPSTLASPASTRAAAVVRLTPNSRAIAASSRSPSGPSGTGRVRRSATLASMPRRCSRPHVLPVPTVDLDAAEAEPGGQKAANHDCGVGHIEDRPHPEVDPVHDRPPQQPGRPEQPVARAAAGGGRGPVSYTHLRAHETVLDLVCRLLLEKKKTKKNKTNTRR